MKFTYDEPAVIARFSHNSGLLVEVIVMPLAASFKVVSLGNEQLISSREVPRIEDAVDYVNQLKSALADTAFTCLD